MFLFENYCCTLPQNCRNCFGLTSITMQNRFYVLETILNVFTLFVRVVLPIGRIDPNI